MNVLKKKKQTASDNENIQKEDDRFIVLHEDVNYKVVELKETGSVSCIFKRK